MHPEIRWERKKASGNRICAQSRDVACKGMLFDLHVHTTFSPCSRMTPKEAVEAARALGLAGLCITDHETDGAASVLAQGLREDGLCVVVGMEYATPQGDFLLFSPTGGGIPGLVPGLAAADLLPRVRRAGGAAVAAHPFRPGRETDESVFRDGLCQAMEIANGRNLPEHDVRARALARRYCPTLTGGSDAHAVEEMGRAPTRFFAPVRGPADLVRALNLGLCRPADSLAALLHA